MRECLVDGPVSETVLSSFFEQRAEHISQYEGVSFDDYERITVSEIRKIQQIPDGSSVNVWFEDDLFCQVNLWFTTSLLQQKSVQIYLVRPLNNSPYGFASYTSNELNVLFEQRIRINDAVLLTDLWNAYQASDFQSIKKQLPGVKEKFPFMENAIQVLLDSCDPPLGYNRLTETLKNIIQSLDDPSFGKVFRTFTENEPHFGYGDLQIKRLYNDLITRVDPNDH